MPIGKSARHLAIPLHRLNFFVNRTCHILATFFTIRLYQNLDRILLLAAAMRTDHFHFKFPLKYINLPTRYLNRIVNVKQEHSRNAITFAYPAICYEHILSRYGHQKAWWSLRSDKCSANLGRLHYRLLILECSCLFLTLLSNPSKKYVPRSAVRSAPESGYGRTDSFRPAKHLPWRPALPDSTIHLRLWQAPVQNVRCRRVKTASSA